MRGTNREKGVRVCGCDKGNSCERKRWTTEVIRKGEKEEAGDGDVGDDKDDDTDEIEGEDRKARGNMNKRKRALPDLFTYFDLPLSFILQDIHALSD